MWAIARCNQSLPNLSEILDPPLIIKKMFQIGLAYTWSKAVCLDHMHALQGWIIRRAVCGLSIDGFNCVVQEFKLRLRMVSVLFD